MHSVYDTNQSPVAISELYLSIHSLCEQSAGSLVSRETTTVLVERKNHRSRSECTGGVLSSGKQFNNTFDNKEYRATLCRTGTHHILFSVTELHAPGLLCRQGSNISGCYSRCIFIVNVRTLGMQVSS